MKIRFAVPEDAPALLAIYGQYIDTSVTFEYELPSAAEFAERIRSTLTCYPYLVWEEEGTIRGYAYAHRAWERAAYSWNAELSVYLDRASTGKGAGRRLYRALMELLRLQGIRAVYGVVTQPNPASSALHRSMGFEKAALVHQAGFKNGAWHDVAWFEKEIAPHGGAPAPVCPVGQLPREQVEAILRKEERS